MVEGLNRNEHFKEVNGKVSVGLSLLKRYPELHLGSLYTVAIKNYFEIHPRICIEFQQNFLKIGPSSQL